MNSKSGKADNFGLRILLGFALAVIVVTAYTAGVKFELLIFALLVGSFTLLFQLVGLSWVWRLVVIGLLLMEIYSFGQLALNETFMDASSTIFLDEDIAIKYNWIASAAASVCITSFWLVMLSTFKLIKKVR